MTACLGMPRYEVEAHIAAILGDAIANNPDKSEAEIERVRQGISLEAMVERGKFRECPEHPGFFGAFFNMSCADYKGGA